MLGALRDAADEAERRPARSLPIEILDYHPVDAIRENEYLVPPGAIAVFLARRDSGMLDSVRRAVSERIAEDELLRQIEGSSQILWVTESVGIMQVSRW